MGAFVDFLARNRRWIGGLGTVIWSAISADPVIVAEHPRLLMYAGVVVAFVLGGGALKSDKYQRDKQEELKQ